MFNLRQMSPCDILRRSRMRLMFCPSFLEISAISTLIAYQRLLYCSIWRYNSIYGIQGSNDFVARAMGGWGKGNSTFSATHFQNWRGNSKCIRASNSLAGGGGGGGGGTRPVASSAA